MSDSILQPNAGAGKFSVSMVASGSISLSGGTHSIPYPWVHTMKRPDDEFSVVTELSLDKQPRVGQLRRVMAIRSVPVPIGVGTRRHIRELQHPSLLSRPASWISQCYRHNASKQLKQKTIVLFYFRVLLRKKLQHHIAMTDSNTMQIRLPGGIISAVIDGDLVRARGVPYASAQRFQQPQQLENWDQFLDCTGPAPVCAQQLRNRLGFLTGSLEEGAPQSEQCLHLNVTVPKKAVGDDQVLPVMVFLHGGGYTSGGSDLGCYEPSGLARRGVVAINVSYRLGIFGYLPIPGFAPVNLGLFDQIAALKWIQGNIASFGGDPNNVTLFGESAGGDSIFCLMVAQGTSGLFHKAILQSAPLSPR